MRSQAPLTAQQQTQQQQDDLFSSSSQLPSTQGGFRFGNQNAVGQSSSHAQGVDDFPPLSRNANGDIGQDRGSNLIQNIGFGSQSNGIGFGTTNHPQPSRTNGLLNAVSGNRPGVSNRVPSPATGTLFQIRSLHLRANMLGPLTTRSPIEASRQGLLAENDPSVSLPDMRRHEFS
jgi:CCR4-NOT transcription complex subunit 2